MSKRQGLEFETVIESDCCSLADMVLELLEAGIDLHCMRDCTRGGVATTLVEIAQTAQVTIEIDEAAIPVDEAVCGACEILGLDPLYVANEGRFLAFVPPDQADRVISIMRKHQAARQANIIGSVLGGSRGQVYAKSVIGVQRVIGMLAGEQLPRIC